MKNVATYWFLICRILNITIHDPHSTEESKPTRRTEKSFSSKVRLKCSITSRDTFWKKYARYLGDCNITALDMLTAYWVLFYLIHNSYIPYQLAGDVFIESA